MTPEQKSALLVAAQALRAETLDRFFVLRRLFPVLKEGNGSDEDHEQFRAAFAGFYQLTGQMVTKEFKAEFFAELLALDLSQEPSPHKRLLLALKKIPSTRGLGRLEFSFVSKLVATHDDAQPIYDSNVRRFLGVPGIPSSGEDSDRIARFLDRLELIRASYESWHPHFDELCRPLIDRMPELASCHPNKVWDFLTWRAGAKPEKNK